MEALIDDIHRTQAHIMWLEHYIALLPEVSVFTNMELDLQQERERARMGRPTVVGSVKWQMEIQRQRQIRTTRSRPGIHPAVKALLDERRHMIDVATKATMLGIKLDAIDFSRKQADLIVGAMAKFAIENGLDPTDKTVSERIVNALESVLAQEQAT